MPLRSGQSKRMQGGQQGRNEKTYPGNYLSDMYEADRPSCTPLRAVIGVFERDTRKKFSGKSHGRISKREAFTNH